jgi:hypothetical protein
MHTQFYVSWSVVHSRLSCNVLVSGIRLSVQRGLSLSAFVGNDDWYSLIPNDHLGIEDVRQIVNKENYWYGL